ncbi:hypothetical protein TIFTF001_021763 [Ficus carica]|uniref:Uncharacterized protein n=1 Tax=Ficus carica TaxID=3494 RepID=A0AA88DDW9_FICCA|nr:hypothetical protein TIFTF001_021763 [Ficus carica]
MWALFLPPRAPPVIFLDPFMFSLFLSLPFTPHWFTDTDMDADGNATFGTSLTIFSPLPLRNLSFVYNVDEN